MRQATTLPALLALAVLLAAGRNASAQDTDPGAPSGSIRHLKVRNLSPYLPTSAAVPYEHTMGGTEIAPAAKWFAELKADIDDFVIFSGDVEEEPVTVTASEIESTDPVAGGGLVFSLWDGLVDVSVSYLRGPIRACGSDTILLEDPEFGPTPIEVSGCLEGDVEVWETDFKFRMARAHARLGGGVWTYVVVGALASIERMEIRFDDGSTIDGTSFSAGAYLEVGVTLSQSARIFTSANRALWGTGSKVERDGGTFYTAGAGFRF